MKIQIPSRNNEPIEITLAIEFELSLLLRIIGYFLLAFSLIDYLAILLPPRLLDPVWEFETMGQLVEHIWAPLLGLGLVFYAQRDTVSRQALRLLSFLSWASLVLGIAYLLMLPLGINNTVQLYDNIDANINIKAVQQKQQLEQFNQRVNATTSPDELVALSKRISPESRAQNNGNLIDLKKQLSQQIQQASANVSAASSQTARQQTKILIKAAVKLNLGALLSGASLITVWNLTRWVRFLHNYG